MDHSGKKLAQGNDFGRTRSSVAFRDPNHDNRSVRSCNRLGCSSRHSSTNGAHNNAEKLKTSRTTVRTSIKSTVGSSSKTASPVSLRKSKEKRSLPSVPKKVIAESSCQEKLIEGSNSRHKAVDSAEPSSVTMGSLNMDCGPNNLETGIFNRFSADSAGASCSKIVHPEAHNLRIRRTRPGSQGISTGSSIRSPVASQNANQSVKSPRGLHTDSQRYGLRNLSCRSITDVLENGSSSSTSHSNGRTDALGRKYSNAESPRCKVTAGFSTRETSTSPRTSTIPSLSIIRRPLTQATSQSARNRPISRYGVQPARTRDAIHGRETKMRFIELGDDMFSLPEPLLIAQEPQLQSPVGESMNIISLLSSFAEASPQPNYTRGTGRGTRVARSRQGIHIVDGSTRNEFDPFRDRSGHRHFDMDGVAEVLLALDRIEQDEELSYEQLMMLETNLLLGGFSIYDQHRDLRLDIDNMSYEELLALGERMGTVNTALSEEEMSKCLKRSIFKSTLTSLSGVSNGDDAKCSICQEEYIAGDEVGKLACEHLYHVVCIYQWFQLKNWCPICKSSALPSKNKRTAHVGLHLLD